MIKPLAKIVLILLGLIAVASAAHAGIHYDNINNIEWWNRRHYQNS